jgi:hypothetical protein
MAHLGFADLLPTPEATPEAADPDAAAQQLDGLALGEATSEPAVAMPEGDGADFFENEGEKQPAQCVIICSWGGTFRSIRDSIESHRTIQENFDKRGKKKHR